MYNMKPTDKNAIKAFCHRCLGYYSDGIRDCKDVNCPLYSRLPRYHKLMPNYDWTCYNPSRVGLVLFDDCKSRTVSEKALEGLKRAREERKKNSVDTVEAD